MQTYLTNALQMQDRAETMNDEGLPGQEFNLKQPRIEMSGKPDKIFAINPLKF